MCSGRLPISVFELVEPLRDMAFISRESPIRTGPVIPRRAAATTNDFQKALENVRIRKSVLSDFLKDEKAITKDNIR